MTLGFSSRGRNGNVPAPGGPLLNTGVRGVTHVYALNRHPVAGDGTIPRDTQRITRPHSGVPWRARCDCSEATAQQIDFEVKKVLDRAYAEAKEVLTIHRDQLKLVTNELLQRESLDGATFNELIGRKVRKEVRRPYQSLRWRRRFNGGTSYTSPILAPPRRDSRSSSLHV